MSAWILASPAKRVMTLYAQNKYDEVIRLMEELRKNGYISPDMLNIAATSAQMIGREDLAERYWKEVLGINPELGVVHFNLANLYSDQKRYDEADAAYRVSLSKSPQFAETYNNYGSFLSQRKRYAEAEAVYRAALSVRPDYQDVYNNLGVLYRMMNRPADAEAAYKKAVAVAPHYVSAYGNLGRLYTELKRFDEAEACHRKALEIRADFAPAYFNLGILYATQKRYGDAEKAYYKAIEIDPNYPEPHGNLGNMYVEMENYGEAERAYAKALDMRPHYHQIVSNLGNLYSRFKLHDKAEELYRQVFKIAPEFSETRFNYANMLVGLKRHAEAEENYRKAIELTPEFPDAYFNYANLLHELRRYDEAKVQFEKTFALRPDYAMAYSNYANMLVDAQRFDEAEVQYLKAIDLAPDFVEGYSNLGVFHKKQRDYQKAEKYYRKALALDPDYPETQFNLSLILLAQQRFEEGWRLYESRYDSRMKVPIAYAPKAEYPQWRGEPLEGKTIMLWHEQGFGDMIQFARYVRALRRRGAKSVTFLTKKPLVSLLKTMEGIDRVVSFEDRATLGAHDYWSLPLSIPIYEKTDAGNIPADTGYLSAPEAARKKWAGSLPQDVFKVGLVWKGSTEHTGDIHRSFASLSVLKSFWSVPGVSFISLQKGQGEDEARNPPEGQPLFQPGLTIDDFGDVAAIIEQLDLVISVDTAIVHLAGAMGKPVWTFIPYIPDWRWLLDGETSAWYPTLRMFRQHDRGNWAPNIEQAQKELAALVAAASGAPEGAAKRKKPAATKPRKR